VKKGEKNTIVTSFNRNFARRNDGNAETNAFIGSPEIVTALAFAGKLSFNPLTDEIALPDGRKFRFQPPSGRSCRRRASPTAARATSTAAERQDDRDSGGAGERPPAAPRALPPLGREGHPGVARAAQGPGKCTTDHISAAGPWLKYRGHLENISGNL